MPVKSKRDEEKWSKAKAIAAERGQGENYALITGIYKKMDPDYFKKSGARVAAAWLVARRDEGLWQQFLDDVYEGGKKMVRNTNRDTRDRYPQVEAVTLLRTDPKFRKLLRGQFGKWGERQEKSGPRGDAIQNLGELQQGQTIEWTQDQQTVQGVVERARPNRAIVRRQDGNVVHILPGHLDSWAPRVV